MLLACLVTDDQRVEQGGEQREHDQAEAGEPIDDERESMEVTAEEGLAGEQE